MLSSSLSVRRNRKIFMKFSFKIKMISLLYDNCFFCPIHQNNVLKNKMFTFPIGSHNITIILCSFRNRLSEYFLTQKKLWEDYFSDVLK